MPYRKYTREEGPSSVGPGWKDLVLACFDVCDRTGLPYRAEQIKEKFAGLRFYVSFGGNGLALTEEEKDRAWQAQQEILQIQRRSFSLCEECGEPGERSTDGNYVQTLCGKHRQNRPDAWGGGTTTWWTYDDQEDKED